AGFVFSSFNNEKFHYNYTKKTLKLTSSAKQARRPFKDRRALLFRIFFCYSKQRKSLKVSFICFHFIHPRYTFSTYLLYANDHRRNLLLLFVRRPHQRIYASSPSPHLLYSSLLPFLSLFCAAGCSFSNFLLNTKFICSSSPLYILSGSSSIFKSISSNIQ